MGFTLHPLGSGLVLLLLLVPVLAFALVGIAAVTSGDEGEPISTHRACYYEEGWSGQTPMSTEVACNDPRLPDSIRKDEP